MEAPREDRTFEVLVNAILLATNAADAADVVEQGEWLNYRDEAGVPHGKIVYLFPEQERTRLIAHRLVGDPIPLVGVEGERLDHVTVRRYVVGVILTVLASTESDAANFVANRGWYCAGTSVDLSGVSAPMAPATPPGII